MRNLVNLLRSNNGWWLDSEYVFWSSDSKCSTWGWFFWSHSAQRWNILCEGNKHSQRKTRKAANLEAAHFNPLKWKKTKKNICLWICSNARLITLKSARVALELVCFCLPAQPVKVEPGPNCVLADGVMGGRRCPGVWWTDAGLIGAYQVFLQS